MMPTLRLTRTSASRRASRRAPLFAATALLVALALPLADAHAQPARTALTTSGLPLLVTGTTGADFEAGFVLLGASSFTIESQGKAKDFPRTATVQVRCGLPCPVTGGTAAANGLQWRRDDQVTWTSLTNGFTTVESNSMASAGTWGRTIFWRYLLDWTATPPSTNTQFLVDFQLVVSSP